MMVGPKKFVGKMKNSQIHQHTNKRVTHTDFDTFSLINRNTTNSQSTQANSHKNNLRSVNSGSSIYNRPNTQKKRRDQAATKEEVMLNSDMRQIDEQSCSNKGGTVAAVTATLSD